MGGVYPSDPSNFKFIIVMKMEERAEGEINPVNHQGDPSGRVRVSYSGKIFISFAVVGGVAVDTALPQTQVAPILGLAWKRGGNTGTNIKTRRVPLMRIWAPLTRGLGTPHRRKRGGSSGETAGGSGG